MNEPLSLTPMACSVLTATVALSALLSFAKPLKAQEEPLSQARPSEPLLDQESPSRQVAPTGTLTPEQVLGLAVEQNPSLRAALIETQRSESLVKSEQSRYVPLFNAEVGYRAGQTIQPSPRPPGFEFISTQTLSSLAALRYTMPAGTSLNAAFRLERAVQDSVVLGNLGTVYGSSLSLEVTQPWLRGFGREVGEGALSDALQAAELSELERRARANAVAAEVLSAYWTLWFLERQRETVRDSLTLQRESLQLARVREEVGVGARADIVRLKAEVAQAAEELLALQGQARAQRLELERLTGQDYGQLQDTTEEVVLPELDPALSQADDETIVQLALTRSPEIERLKRLAERADLQTVLAEDQARADLQTVATLNVNGIGQGLPMALAQLATFNSAVGYIGLRLSLPLVQKGLEASAERAALGARRAREDLDGARNAATAQALTLINELRVARERVALLKEAAEAFEESATIERARFEASEGTSFEVTQALTRLRQSELRALSAARDAYLAQIALKRLLGLLVEAPEELEAEISVD